MERAKAYFGRISLNWKINPFDGIDSERSEPMEQAKLDNYDL